MNYIIANNEVVILPNNYSGKVIYANHNIEEHYVSGTLTNKKSINIIKS